MLNKTKYQGNVWFYLTIFVCVENRDAQTQTNQNAQVSGYK